MHTLNATIRFSHNIGVDFTLGRDWLRTSCAAPAPRCAPGHCSARDRIATAGGQRQRALTAAGGQRHRASTTSSAGWPVPVSVGSWGPLADACDVGYFVCLRGSARCEEMEASAEAMDRSGTRALFLACGTARVRWMWAGRLPHGAAAWP